jgi:hypothetical protein
MKWAFIYTLCDPNAELRIDVIGMLTCVGVSSVAAAPEVARRWLQTASS